MNTDYKRRQNNGIWNFSILVVLFAAVMPLVAMDNGVHNKVAPFFALWSIALPAGNDPVLYGYRPLASFKQVALAPNQRVLVKLSEGSYTCALVISPIQSGVQNPQVPVLVRWLNEQKQFKTEWRTQGELLVHATWNASTDLDSFISSHKGVVKSYTSLSEWVEDLPSLSATTSMLDRTCFLNLCHQVRELYLKELGAASWHHDNNVFRAACPTGMIGDFNAQKFLHCYVQKKELQRDDSVFIFGDLHGDVHSLIHALQKLHKDGLLSDDLRLTNTATRLVFLGDYVDRGLWSVEVLYLVLLLKLNNFDQVVLLRGNHEAKECNETFGHTLASELQCKFGLSVVERERWVYSLYDMLPVALYLGCPVNATREVPQGLTWTLCCHGGLEIGFSASDFLQARGCQYAWLSEINRMREVVKLSKTLQDSIVENSYMLRMKSFVPKNKNVLSEEHVVEDFLREPAEKGLQDIGFLWNDFSIVQQDCPFLYSRERGCTLGKDITNELMERDGISMIIRGHQHSGDMWDMLCMGEGCVALFDETVYTVLSGNLDWNLPFFDYAFVRLALRNFASIAGWQVDVCSQINEAFLAKMEEAEVTASA